VRQHFVFLRSAADELKSSVAAIMNQRCGGNEEDETSTPTLMRDQK